MAACKHNLKAPLFSGYRLNRRDVSIALAVTYFAPTFRYESPEFWPWNAPDKDPPPP
jgi:hypothetical protein